MFRREKINKKSSTSHLERPPNQQFHQHNILHLQRVIGNRAVQNLIPQRIQRLYTNPEIENTFYAGAGGSLNQEKEFIEYRYNIGLHLGKYNQLTADALDQQTAATISGKMMAYLNGASTFCRVYLEEVAETKYKDDGFNNVVSNLQNAIVLEIQAVQKIANDPGLYRRALSGNVTWKDALYMSGAETMLGQETYTPGVGFARGNTDNVRTVVRFLKSDDATKPWVNSVLAALNIPPQDQNLEIDISRIKDDVGDKQQEVANNTVKLLQYYNTLINATTTTALPPAAAVLMAEAAGIVSSGGGDARQQAIAVGGLLILRILGPALATNGKRTYIYLSKLIQLQGTDAPNQKEVYLQTNAINTALAQHRGTMQNWLGSVITQGQAVIQPPQPQPSSWTGGQRIGTSAPSFTLLGRGRTTNTQQPPQPTPTTTTTTTTTTQQPPQPTPTTTTQQQMTEEDFKQMFSGLKFRAFGSHKNEKYEKED